MFLPIMLLLIQIGVSEKTPPADWDIRARLPPLQFVPDSTAVETTLLESIDKNDGQAIIKDCLIKLQDCERSGDICKVDLEIFKQFCGNWNDERSLLGCEKRFLNECRSALRTLNFGRLNMSHCTCDGHPSRSIDDLSKCNLFRRNLNGHPCVQNPPLFLTDPAEYPPMINQVKDPSYHESFQSKQVQRYPVNQQSKQEKNRISNQTDNRPTDIDVRPTSPGIYDVAIRYPKESNIHNTIDNATQNQHKNVSGKFLRFGAMSKVSNPDCLTLLDRCTKKSSCARALNQVRAMCTPRSCEKLRNHCLQAYNEIRAHQLDRNCSCDSQADETRKRCLDYRNTVSINPCIEGSRDAINIHKETSTHLITQRLSTWTAEEERIDQLSRATSYATDVKIFTNSTSFEWQKGSNCYEVYVHCIHDHRCLSYYLQLIENCGAFETVEITCHRWFPRCSKTLLEFYNELQATALQVTHCNCLKNDSDCFVQEKIFKPQCLSSTVFSNSLACSTLWKKCVTSKICVYILDMMQKGCNTDARICQTQCSDISSMLAMLLGARNCQCLKNQIFEYHELAFNCEDQFKPSLMYPICASEPQTMSTFSHRLPGRDVACFLSRRLGFSFSNSVRIYSDVSTKTKKDLGTPHCSQICSCMNGCSHRFCNVYHGNPGSDEVNIDKASPDKNSIYSNENYRHFIVNQVPCLYIPMIEKSCSCQSTGEVKCEILSANDNKRKTDYILEVSLNPEELRTILRMLNESVLDRDMFFYTQLFKFATHLSSLFESTLSAASCELMLRKIVFQNDLYPKATPVEPGVVNKKAVTRGIRDMNLFYAVVINTTQFETNENIIEKDISTCLLQLRLLVVMINQRFPRIKYHPLLSVLKSAQLTRQSSPVHVEQSTIYSWKQANELKTESPFMWRQPRTSANKIRPKQNGVSKRTGNTHRPTWLLSTGILLIPWLVWSFG